ncbi:hypothetical protein HY605_05225 [Candidatus Peregrinibacteria bacterium]|nr:hypothetical protein [Candidatus Peregrinibacteria bacterium]
MPVMLFDEFDQLILLEPAVFARYWVVEVNISVIPDFRDKGNIFRMKEFNGINRAYQESVTTAENLIRLSKASSTNYAAVFLTSKIF